jgi:hypothetical protein
MCKRNLRWQRNKSKAVSLGRTAVSPASRSPSVMLGNLMLTTHSQEEGNVLYSAINNTIGAIHDNVSSFSVVTFFCRLSYYPFQTKPHPFFNWESECSVLVGRFLSGTPLTGVRKTFFSGARTCCQRPWLEAVYETLCGILKSTLVQ